MMKIKIVGKRSGQTAPTLENANTLLKTMQQLRGGKAFVRAGCIASRLSRKPTNG